MPDTGAPYFIPFADPTDLVRDWPALSEDVAEAVADGLDAAGGLVATGHALKTDAFSASVAVGAVTLITGLEVTITPSDAGNNLLVVANVQTAKSSNSRPLITVFRDDSPILIGDAAGSRLRVSAMGFEVANLGQTLTVVGVVAAGSTSATTFDVRIGHLRTAAADTVRVNQSDSDADNAGFGRAVSSLTVLEVKV